MVTVPLWMGTGMRIQIILLNKTEKLGIEDIEKYMAKWQGELAESRGMLAGSDMNNRPKPWKKKCEFVKTDVVGKLHIVLSNGVYIDTLNLMPRIQNQIRSLAAFDNPEFYKNKRLGYSNCVDACSTGIL